MTLASRSFIAFCFALLFFAPVYVALNRFVSPDEGFYLYASRLVMEGMLPYRDFFYPQALLYPYLYGAWMSLFGFTWESGRLLSAMLSIGTGILLYFHLRRELSATMAAFGVFLLASSVLILQWGTITKAAAASMFFLFASFVCAAQPWGSSARLGMFFSGALCALSMQMRLPMAPAGPLIALWILLQGGQSTHGTNRWSRVLWFIGGGVFMSIPSLLSFALYPDEFLFNNLGYHLDRTIMGERAIERNKRVVLGVLTGFHESKRIESYQFPMLFYGSVSYFLFSLFRKGRIDLSASLAFLLIAVHLAPSPTYVQYFVVVVPFLIVPFMRLIAEISDLLARRLRRSAVLPRLALCIIALPVYLHAVPSDVRDAIVTGQGMGGPRDNPETFRIERIKAVSRAVNELTQPGDVVFSRWPGYLLETHAKALAGTENHFALAHTENKKLSDAYVDKYRLSTNERVLRALDAKQAELALVYADRRFRSALETAFLERGYRKIRRVSSVHFYRVP